MKAVVRKSQLKGEINTVASKSYSHRIMIASSLCEQPTIIKGLIKSKDEIATKLCLESMGATFNHILEKGSDYEIIPICNKSVTYPKLNCFESGSTLRFLLPVLCAKFGKGNVDGAISLRNRPLNDLINALTERGAIINSNKLPLEVHQSITPGNYTIRGDVSSQYISGLLFALPLLHGDSRLIIENKLVSKGYVDVTIDVLNKFGVVVENCENGYSIKGNQKYISPGEITIEGDWSNAAVLITAAAINGNVTLNNLNLSSFQGDREIVTILQKMGADIKSTKSSVTIKKSDLVGIEIDGENIPDIVPPIALACAVAQGKSVIKNIERLRLKECDRVAAIVEILHSFGISVESDKSNIYICGGSFSGYSVKDYNDHRMVMMASIAGLISNGSTVINGCEAVEKSYPKFFHDVVELGGKINVDV